MQEEGNYNTETERRRRRRGGKRGRIRKKIKTRFCNLIDRKQKIIAIVIYPFGKKRLQSSHYIGKVIMVVCGGGDDSSDDDGDDGGDDSGCLGDIWRR